MNENELIIKYEQGLRRIPGSFTRGIEGKPYMVSIQRGKNINQEIVIKTRKRAEDFIKQGYAKESLEITLTK